MVGHLALRPWHDGPRGPQDSGHSLALGQLTVVESDAAGRVIPFCVRSWRSGAAIQRILESSLPALCLGYLVLIQPS